MIDIMRPSVMHVVDKITSPPDCDLEAVDLTRRLLSLSPERRFTANRSLSHPYVRQFYTQRDVR